MALLEFYKDGLLGFVQGATELLPVSSSGHLLIVSELINKDPSLFFITFLHLATLIAVIIGYRKTIIKILKDTGNLFNVALRIVITSIPAGLLGLLIADLIDDKLQTTQFIAFNLIFWGIAMIVTEQVIRIKNLKPSEEKFSFATLPLYKAFVIGLGQALALLPGTSRSGITTLSGVWLGLPKDKALDYSFIAGLPLIAAAFVFEFIKDGSSELTNFNSSGIFGLLIAFIFGYIFVEVLHRVKKKDFLTFFGVYRIILGIGLLIWLV
jgi:undecaprenyl-diphosphatase